MAREGRKEGGRGRQSRALDRVRPPAPMGITAKVKLPASSLASTPPSLVAFVMGGVADDGKEGRSGSVDHK